MSAQLAYLIHPSLKAELDDEDKEPDWEKRGILSFSRHPGLFFEAVFWAAFCIVIQGGLTATGFTLTLICLAAAGLWSFVAVVVTYETEADADSSASEKYQQFKKSTPLVISPYALYVNARSERFPLPPAIACRCHPAPAF